MARDRIRVGMGIVGLFSIIPLTDAYGDDVGRFPPLSSLVPSEWAFTTIVNSTAQVANFRGSNGEVLASFDLIGSIPGAGGQINFYIEGNTSPTEDGISKRLSGVNADAGTALDRDGRGRFQLSEFNYSVHVASGIAAIGLIDPAAYLDVSTVANSEKKQFLNARLKNNAAILFPNYTLSLMYHSDPIGNQWPGYTLFVGSSHGLANNADATYTSLIDVTASEKGVFSVAEFYHESNMITPRVGVWSKTGDRAKYAGFYTSIDGRIDRTAINVRVGSIAIGPSVLRNSVAFAASHRLSFAELGAGVSFLQGSENTFVRQSWQSEFYARMHLHKELYVSPSLQYLSADELGGNQTGSAAWISSLRMTYEL